MLGGTFKTTRFGGRVGSIQRRLALGPWLDLGLVVCSRSSNQAVSVSIKTTVLMHHSRLAKAIAQCEGWSIDLIVQLPHLHVPLTQLSPQELERQRQSAL